MKKAKKSSLASQLSALSKTKKIIWNQNKTKHITVTSRGPLISRTPIIWNSPSGSSQGTQPPATASAPVVQRGRGAGRARRSGGRPRGGTRGGAPRGGAPS